MAAVASIEGGDDRRQPVSAERKKIASDCLWSFNGMAIGRHDVS